MEFAMLPRFSTRALFVAVGCCALIAAVYSARSHRQRAAVAEIEALGGSVQYGPSIVVGVERLLPLDFIASVEEVSCSHTMFVDGPNFVFDIGPMIPHLRRLPRLKRVFVFEINHGRDVPKLRRVLPGVEIVVRSGGVVG